MIPCFILEIKERTWVKIYPLICIVQVERIHLDRQDMDAYWAVKLWRLHGFLFEAASFTSCCHDIHFLSLTQSAVFSYFRWAEWREHWCLFSQKATGPFCVCSMQILTCEEQTVCMPCKYVKTVCGVFVASLWHVSHSDRGTEEEDVCITTLVFFKEVKCVTSAWVLRWALIFFIFYEIKYASN